MVILGPTEGLKLSPLPDEVLGMAGWIYGLAWVDLLCGVVPWGCGAVYVQGHHPVPTWDKADTSAPVFSNLIYFLSKALHLQYLKEPGVQ